MWHTDGVVHHRIAVIDTLTDQVFPTCTDLAVLEQ